MDLNINSKNFLNSLNAKEIDVNKKPLSNNIEKIDDKTISRIDKHYNQIYFYKLAKLIKNEISLYFKEDFIYQSFPTFRIHIPNYKAIHQWHYDSDPIHKHPPWEINVQVPLTKMIKTQATWIESVPGLEDFSPMEMNYGEYVFFDGNRCKHGNKVNEEDRTRVSFDFRVMPLSKYTGQSKSSVTSQKRFIIGEYYKIFNKLAEG